MKYPLRLSVILFWLLCFSSYGQINSNSFSPKVDLSLGTTTSTNFGKIADYDSDGKPDIAVVHHNATTASLSVFRNEAIAGVINSSSFGARQDFSSLNNAHDIDAADLDGDGKPDIVTGRWTSVGLPSSLSIYQNTSIPGSISFNTAIVYPLVSTMSSLILKDMDGDNLPDLIGSFWFMNYVRVYRNISTLGVIAFDTVSYITLNANSGTTFLVGEDFNGDNMPDLAVCNQNSSNISIYKNTSSIGLLSFVSSSTLTGGTASSRIATNDIDNDGKKDLVVSNSGGGTIGVFRNTSTSTTISFAAQVTFVTVNTNGPIQLQCADMDGDNKPDIVVGNLNQSTVSVFRNFGIPNVINTSTFASRKQFSVGSNPESFVSDIDGDGKKDIIAINRGSGTISILHNRTIPSNGLVAYYPFSNNAGDSSGFDNHGVSSGVTTIVDRNQNSASAYNFDGVNDRVSVAANPAFNVNGFSNIMFSCWVNPALGTFSPATRRVFHMIDGAGNAMEINYNYGTNKFEYVNWDHSIQFSYVLTSLVTSARQTWHHVAVRIDSTNTTTIFINGLPQGTMNSVPVKPTNASFDIGRHTAQGWYFAGGIDEVRINSNYISDYEILRMVNSTVHYYTKSTGDINVLSTWGENTDGTGASPLSFDSSNVIYHLTNNTSPSMSGNLSINGSGSVLIFGDGSNSYNLTVPALNTISCDSMYVNSNITLTVMGGLTSTKLGSAASSTVQYLSPTTQNIAGGVYENLVIGMSTKTLTSHTTIRNNFGMLSSVNGNGYDLTLGTSTSSRGTLNRTEGTINGKFIRWFNNATNSGTTGVFPVGTATRYAPIQIDYTSAPTTGGKITAEFIAANPGNIGLPQFDFTVGAVFIDKAAIDGYWKISSSGLSGGMFTNTVTANGFTGVNDYTTLRMIRRNTSGSWTLQGNAGTNSGSNGAAVVSRTGMTTLTGEYGLGGDQSANPLPVKLIYFAGKVVDVNTSLLTWQTSAEINAGKFLVQRSTDNSKWIGVGEVKAVGNTLSVSNYSFRDNIAGLSGVVYYRLVQVDMDGRQNIEKSIKITIDDDLKSASVKLSIYPNPTSDKVFVNGTFTKATIFDVTGKAVKEIVAPGWVNIESLPAGMYFINCDNETLKLIKR